MCRSDLPEYLCLQKMRTGFGQERVLISLSRERSISDCFDVTSTKEEYLIAHECLLYPALPGYLFSVALRQLGGSGCESMERGA